MQADRQLKHYTKKTPTNIYSAPKHARQKIQKEKQGGKETKKRAISQSKKINKAAYKSSVWEWLTGG